MTEPHRDAEVTTIPARGSVELVDVAERTEELSHAEIRAFLSDYLDRNLDSARQRQIEAHLRACPDCRAFRDTLRETIHALGSLPAPAAPPGAKRRVLDRLRS